MCDVIEACYIYVMYLRLAIHVRLAIYVVYLRLATNTDYLRLAVRVVGVETHSFEVGLKKKIFTRLAIYVALLLATYVYSRLAICVAYLRLSVRVEPTEGSLYT